MKPGAAKPDKQDVVSALKVSTSAALALSVGIAAAGAWQAPAKDLRPSGSGQSDRRPIVSGSLANDASRETAITGWAWTADNRPIPHAPLRLRAVASGHLEASGRTDQIGTFLFRNAPPSTYVVELVDKRGRVRAVSDVFLLEPSQTVTTFVRLPSRDRVLGAWFDGTAAALVAAAVGSGITAIALTGRPASPER